MANKLFINKETISRVKMELNEGGFYSDETLGNGSEAIADATISIIEVLMDQKHSMESASKVLDLVIGTLNGKLLAPLTTNKKEWKKTDKKTKEEDDIFVNVRFPRVIRLGKDRYVDTQGVVFQLPDGKQVVGEGSMVEVPMPYMPRSQVIPVDAEGKVIQSEPESSTHVVEEVDVEEVEAEEVKDATKH